MKSLMLKEMKKKKRRKMFLFNRSWLMVIMYFFVLDKALSGD